MKTILLVISIVLIILIVIVALKLYKLKNIQYYEPEILHDKKVLTVYYSNIGNTKVVAQNIHSIVGGDIKEIQLEDNYPNNIFKMSATVRKQIKEGYLPKIDDIDISDYDVIFVGSPIWNFSVSLPIKSFLKNNNLENKVIIPFFTYSGGANKNKIIKEIKDLSNAKDIRKPLFMFESGIFLIKEQIINQLNML